MSYLDEVMKQLLVLKHNLESSTQFAVHQHMAARCQDAVNELIECLPKHDMTKEEIAEVYTYKRK